MQNNAEKINALYFLTFCTILLYVLLLWFSGNMLFGFFATVCAGIFIYGYALLLKNNVGLAQKLIIISCSVMLLMLDSRLSDNTGFIFYYLVLAFLLINTQLPGRLKSILTALAVSNIILVNFTNFMPQLGSAINNYYHTNFTLYTNLAYSLLFVLFMHNKKSKSNDTIEIGSTENNDIYKNILLHDEQAILIADKAFNILFCNQKFKELSIRITGKHLVEGDNIQTFFKHEPNSFFMNLLQDAVTLGRKETVLEKNHNNQKELYKVVATLADDKIVVKANIDKAKTEVVINDSNQKLGDILKYFDDVLIVFDANNLCVDVIYSQADKLIFPENYYHQKSITTLFDEPFKVKFSQLVNEARTTNQNKQTEFTIKVNGVVKHYAARIIPQLNKQVFILLKDETYFKNQLKEAAKQKEFLDKLIANIPMGICVKNIKEGMKYTLWNKEMERLFKLKESDVLGKTDKEVFGSFEQFEAYTETDNMVIESKEPLLINKLQINSDNINLILRNIKLPILDKKGNVEQIINIIENITHITKTQEELELAESRWNFAITGSRDAVWDINLTNNDVYFSPVFKKMLGYSEDEEPEIVLNDIILKDDLEKVNAKLMEHLTGKTDFYEAEYRMIKKDGSIIWVLDRGKICEKDEAGNPLRITGTFTDITYRKQLEEQLIAAINEAESAARAKSLFLSTMSHEIRTPMNAVTGMINLLVDNVQPEKKELVNSLKNAADSLMYLLNDILDFSKIDAGKIELEHIEFNLKDIAEKTVELYQIKAKGKEIDISLQYDDKIPAVLIGDPIRIGQVLSNLVSNAVKFTNQGNVLIEMILRSKNENHASIEFAVSDTGIGIEENKIPYIFDAFSQAQSDISRNFGGTGLGLAICKKLVELFGSKIYVTSKPGIGSKFWFTIRLPYVDKTSININDNQTEGIPAVSLHGMRVLIAEDNKMNQYVLVKFLTNWGVEFDMAENGLQATELFKKKKYHLVLMDLQMPEMDGFEATKIIREINTQIPVFALTANAFSDVKEMAYKIGMNDFIAKPFQPSELLKKLVKVYQETKKQPVNFKLFN